MQATRFVVIDLRAEANVVVLTLGRGVHPRPRDPVVWAFLEVPGKEVLSQRLAHLFEEISEMPDYREVPSDCMVSLREITNRDDCDQQKDKSQRERYRHERSE
jgi:hypothetical protein